MQLLSIYLNRHGDRLDDKNHRHTAAASIFNCVAGSAPIPLKLHFIRCHRQSHAPVALTAANQRSSCNAHLPTYFLSRSRSMHCNFCTILVAAVRYSMRSFQEEEEQTPIQLIASFLLARIFFFCAIALVLHRSTCQPKKSFTP